MSSHDVRDMLDLPGTAGPRPAKKQKIAAPKSTLKGLAREVQSLAGDNPISIVPEISSFKKRRLASRKPAARWVLKPFKNPARGDDLVLAHWRRKAEAPPAPVGEDGNSEQVEAQPEPEIENSTFAKFNVKVDIPEYTDLQYSLKLEGEGWTKDETDYLMGLVKDFDLRWPLIWDRYDYEPLASGENGDSLVSVTQPRSMEDLKVRYYFIADQMLQLHTPLKDMRKTEHDLHEIFEKFDPNQEALRKKFAETALNRTKEEAREEESLLLELKRILARSEKLSEERKELYARLEAPPSNGNIGIYTSSQGLQQLLQQLMTLNNSKKRRSLMGAENMSPASGPSGLQQQGSFDRRDSTMRESISGPSGPSRKGTLQGPPERRELTKEEEKMYGVSQPTEKLSGPSFRADRLNKPITNKSATMQAKITNVLGELGVPSRLIMPTAAVGQEWESLLGNIQKLLELKKNAEKLDGEIAIAMTLKAEREKRERAARGEPDPEDDDHDVKRESDREKSVSRSVRGGSVSRSARGGSTRKRSASVLSAMSDKSTKRQKK
ncbi:SWR1-complex 4 [Hyphodiscus hymeniophilus]|uniref:SWR1-complex protein 4 n=1 Tax=Hyphodiscus hymeniophilus TaxID=353542 RepID=A0A9P6VDX8_9HELO|nr:SWR1-complex 4 [Hyphodiscus hymeniophilus]